MTREAQARLSSEDAEVVSGALETMLLVSLRRDGILFDMRLPEAVNEYPLDRITAPTLVVHAENDALVGFHHAEHTAGAIPGARTIFVAEGGHFGYAFSSPALPGVAAFLNEGLTGRGGVGG